MNCSTKKRHSEKLKDAEKTSSTPGNILTTSITEVFPTGAPKPGKKGESVLTNTISKFAAIKRNEKQIDQNKPFILWLDLQDTGVWRFPVSEALFSPLYSQLRDGHISSGPFWFALYGRKNDPLIKSRGFDYRSIPMAHEGRFYQTMASHGEPTRVSAVVFSLPQATILMENPHTAKPVPKNIRAALLKLPRFRIELSILEWEPGLVSRYLEFQRSNILAVDAALKAFNSFGN